MMDDHQPNELTRNALIISYNQKSDVWALGCVLYEMTTLKHAFNGKNLPALILKILRGIYPPIPDQYSDSLRDLISSMLQTDPDLRPSLEEILAMSFVQVKVTHIARRYQLIKSSEIKQEQDKRNVNDQERNVRKNVRKSLDDIRKMKRQHQQQQQQQRKRQELRDEINDSHSDDADDQYSNISTSEKEDDWLDERKEELYGLLGELHPSQLNVATLRREQMKKEKHNLQKLRLHERRQFYRDQLSKAARNRNRASTEQSHVRDDAPFAQVQPSPRNIPPRRKSQDQQNPYVS